MQEHLRHNGWVDLVSAEGWVALYGETHRRTASSAAPPRCRRRGKLIVAPEADRRLIAAARGARAVPLEIHQFVVKGSARRVYPK